jgi:hypothetical protein
VDEEHIVAGENAKNAQADSSDTQPAFAEALGPRQQL